MAEIDYGPIVESMRKGPKGDPGTSFVSGTIVNDLDNYKVDGYYKMEAGGDDIRNLPPNLTQKYGTLVVITTNGVNRLHQMFHPTATSQGGKLFWIRSMAGAVWSPWRVQSTQRIDTTAGRAIYTYDEINNREQLIYGDTGLLDISSLLVGVTIPTNSFPSMRRVGSTVTIAFNGIAPTENMTGYLEMLSLPNGFRAPQTLNLYASVNTGASPIKSFQFTTGYLVRLYQDPKTTDQIRERVVYDTNDPWPTVLPGVVK